MKSSVNLQSIEAKQAYVQKNIFEGDYDIEAFAQFLAQQPPKNTSNLEELSYDQIRTSVDTFMAENQSFKPKPIYKKNQRNSTLSESRVQILNIDYKDMDFYMKTKECVKQINKFGLASIVVNVISYRKNQGNFLRRDYITFKVELPQLHKQIDRRYSHFEWLRDILGYYHPGVIIPPLPKKKLKKIFTQNHLKKKGKMLQNFLRKSLEIPDLRNDQNFYRFLTIQTPQKFQQFIKENKPQKRLIPFDNIKSATGQIHYGINEQSIKTNKAAADYFQKLTPFMKEFYKEIKRVKEGLDICATHLDNLEIISKKFASIEQKFRRDCNNKDINEHDEREKSFIDTIALIAEKYKQQLKAMAQVWEKELYAKMKYQFHLSDHIVGFINDYQSDERKFHGSKDSLKKKKLKLYSKQISQWGLNQEKVTKFLNQKPSFSEVAPFMLWKKTQQVEAEQEIYALQTKQLSNSIIHFARTNNQYNLKSLERFLRNQHQLQVAWLQKLKQIITQKLDFPLIEVNSVKQKVISTVSSTGSSIKGFFSQFTGPKEKEPQKAYKFAIETNQQQ